MKAATFEEVAFFVLGLVFLLGLLSPFPIIAAGEAAAEVTRARRCIEASP